MTGSRMLMIALMAAAVCVVSAGVGAAATLTVDDDGDADYTSIQAAVDAASAGDVVIVRDGIYTENVNVCERLTIRSGNGFASTTLQAADSDGGGLGDTLLPYHSSGNIANGRDYLPLVIQSASISGRVCEEDGVTPIGGATVTAVEWDATPLGFARESTTDADGTYILTNLSAGDYRVYAYAPEYGREFYPDTYFWDDAQPVSLLQVFDS